MIDFNKFRTPEAREASRIAREKREAEMTTKSKSQERMIDYLLEQESLDKITSDWDLTFIRSVNYRFRTVGILTDKQDAKLTELYEKY